jgi:hypothetical protein
MWKKALSLIQNFRAQKYHAFDRIKDALHSVYNYVHVEYSDNGKIYYIHHRSKDTKGAMP